MPDVRLPLSGKIGARPRKRPAALIRRAFNAALYFIFIAGVLLQGLIVAYRFVDPPASTLMLGQRLTGAHVRQAWVPINRISPHLIRAVIMSEDGQFCRHHGINWPAIETALERSQDGLAGGGSTISMQVAKNLFLWPSKSYLRKAIELPVTLDLELFWSKRRILEIYLNIAEWGPGLFGAEAAAQAYFRKPAEQLSEREAALLAISLPNPADRRANAPTPLMQRLADTIQRRVAASVTHATCVLARP
jgi:monofunctional glycosyltransferase